MAPLSARFVCFAGNATAATALTRIVELKWRCNKAIEGGIPAELAMLLR